jgi:hypothetical protein
MPTTTDKLDISQLPATSRRAIRDFYQFLLSRSVKTRKTQPAKYNFTDLCGGLSWKGDAVAAQRCMRVEWQTDETGTWTA